MPASLFTAEQQKKCPEEQFSMLFDGATMMVGPQSYWMSRWQPAEGGGDLAPGLITFTSHFELDGAGDAADQAHTLGGAGGSGGADGADGAGAKKTGVTQFIFGADQAAWMWLEAADKMGPRPSSSILRVPNEANAARLRRLLDATPWWVALHAHSPRLIRECCPFAVALLLDRADWLTAEEAATMPGLFDPVLETCATKRDTLAASSAGNNPSGGDPSGAGRGMLVITDTEPAVLPLLKAALFVPTSPLCQAIFCGEGDPGGRSSGGPGGSDAAAVAARAAAVADAARFWSAQSPPQSLPSVVYESVRKWADITGGGNMKTPTHASHRGDMSMNTAMLLELLTLLAARGEGAATAFAIVAAVPAGRLAARVVSNDGTEVRVSVEIKTGDSSRTSWRNRGEDEEGSSSCDLDVVWRMPDDWVVSLPVQLGMSPDNIAETHAHDVQGMSEEEANAIAAANAPCNEALFAAVEAGDAVKIERILRAKLAERPADAPPFASGGVEAAAFFEGPTNGMVKKGVDYLALAAQLGRTAAIEVLCDVGGYSASRLTPSPPRPGFDGECMMSVLLTASLQPNASAVRALIDRGAPCDSVDAADNCAAIHNSILNNDAHDSHVGVARELLTNPISAAATKASLTLLQAPSGLPALFQVASRNQLAMLELLLEHGATIAECAVPPQHPLYNLLTSGSPPGVRGAARASLRDTAYALMHSYWGNAAADAGVRKNLLSARNQGRVVDLMLRHCPPTSAIMRKLIDQLPRPRSEDGNVATGSLVCANCTKPSTTKCSACKKVRYCSRDCQKEHWKLHKKDCKK